MNTPADSAQLRRWVYTLLIVVAMGGILGRILSVTNVVEPYLSRSDPGQSAAAILVPLAASSPTEAAVLVMLAQDAWFEIDEDEPARLWPRARPRPVPTLGGNDRSRWATIRALVDDGTYAIGRRKWLVGDDPTPFVVASTVGLMGSPLTPSPLIAATALFPGRTDVPTKYLDEGIMMENGWGTLDRVLHPERQEFYSSKPPLLPTLLAGEYWLLKHLLGWSIADKDGRWSVVRVGLVTVNWLPMLIYLVLLARIAERFGTTNWGRLYVVAAGAFATFMTPFAITLNNHTIAACSALFALYPALRVLDSSDDSLARGVTHGARRNEGPSAHLFALSGLFAGFTATCELPAASFLAGLFLLLMVRAPGRTLAFFVPAALLPIAALLWTNYLAIGEFMPAYSKLDSPWYRFEGGYWRPDPSKRGIDWAWQRESKLTYTFHLMIGHHGLFSLSPIWLLAMAGIVVMLMSQRGESRASSWASIIMGGPSEGKGIGLILVSALTLFLTVVVISFYLLFANRMSNNYGGWTCGPRWFLWLTPFWLVTLLPAADRLSTHRWGRVLAYLALGISVLSVSYPAWNPWRHPWLYNFFESQGWIRY